MIGLIPWAFAAANLKRDLAAAWSWITHASFWQIMSIGLLCIAVVQHFTLTDARHDRDSYKNQRDEYRAQIDAADAKVRKAHDVIAQLSRELKDRTDAENRRIADDAAALRVSGPGKALCRPASAASGGHEQAPAKPDAPGPALPPDDRAAVPWGWLVQRAQEHDELLARSKAWDEWYAALVKNWPKNEPREPQR